MTAFREIMQQAKARAPKKAEAQASIWLPEDLICRIGAYVKFDGDELGHQELAKVQEIIKRCGYCGGYGYVLDWQVR